ncbi:MAG: chaperone NapD [Halieaceae bacterium]|jgi:nitrate reductase NapD|nr:chaperone NapD [Halieaceae bacterium]
MALSRRALLSGAKETHFASLVVHCRPEALASATQAINAMPKIDVPASDNNAKLVVMLEMGDESELLGSITNIEAIPGVVSATLVFHQVEDREALS